MWSMTAASHSARYLADPQLVASLSSAIKSNGPLNRSSWFINWPFNEEFFTQKNPRQKNQKISKRIHKIKEFLFEDLKFVCLFWKWTTPQFQCLNPFFNYKILVHQTKNFEKSEKIKGFFFWGFSHLFWEWTTIKSSYTIKNPEKIPKITKKSENPIKSKKSEKSEKIQKNPTPLILVLKSFFIYKILVQPTKFRKKNKKIRKIWKNSKDLFQNLKCVNLIWEWKTPRHLSIKFLE